ncbi:MAG: hypothetical protein HQL16_01015 [Candidatus Omnitrophica bacterium]|nr:hypothetical protein [Candidatus Omnitrophota bacterium]
MGKYNNWYFYLIAKAYRIFIRMLIAPLVTWKSQSSVEDGCTAIIGLCSSLPWILPANLRGLRLAKWPELKEVIIVVDRFRDDFFASFEEGMMKEFKDLNIRFIYYGFFQKTMADILKLPYVNSWLSWCIAIRETKTSSFFIQDYDALLLGDVLSARYLDFKESKSVFYAVSWYGEANGIVKSDNLGVTFEAFVDTSWARSQKAIQIFNRIGLINDRPVDFDTFLYLQSRYSDISQRKAVAMTDGGLVHPSQMISQYTVYKRRPGHPWDCSALVMIPFFYYVSGQQDIFRKALMNIRSRKGMVIELLADGCLMNFENLETEHLNRILDLILQGFGGLGIPLFEDFYNYGNAFYDLIETPAQKRLNFFKTDHSNSGSCFPLPVAER